MLFLNLSLFMGLLACWFEMISANNLIIMPKPFESNRIKAPLDEDFRLSCITDNDETSPNGLRWISPANEPIGQDTEKRMYTILKKNQLILHFDKLVPTDAGTYICSGIKDSQPNEMKIELVLEKKISFINTPLEQFVKPKPDVLIECHASAIPGPEIAWFRKGSGYELKNSEKYQITNDGLIIKNPTSNDEGIYYCQASVTSTGEVKRAEINVQIMQEPRWIIKPEDTNGVKDEDVVIKCEAHAKPVAKYQWLRDGVVLAGSRYVISGNSLRILQLQRQDTGTYTCSADNESGNVQANFRLNVFVPPVIAPIDDVHVIEGDQATIRCVVKEAFPKAVIEWRYADSLQVINPSQDTNFKIIDDSDQNANNPNGNLVGSWSELIIERANRDYRRNFTCRAINDALVVDRQVQLLVEYKPNLLLTFESREYYYSWIQIDEYGNSGSQSSQSTRSYPVTLTCQAAGEPSPQITWYFKSVQIKHDDVKYRLIRDEPGLSKMEITPKSLDDFGEYQCKAENRLGKEYRNIQLRQATPPKFAPSLFLKSTKPEAISFEIKPSDAPESDGGLPIETYRIQWRFTSSDWTTQFEKDIPVDTTSLDKKIYVAEITSLMPDTEYLFRIAGVNKAGLGVWTVKELKVKTSPRRQPDPVRVTSKEDCQASTRCYIEWAVDSNGGSPVREFMIRWRRISYKDSNNQHVNTDRIEPWSTTKIIKAPLTNYEIIHLQPNSFYEVDVLARNDIGPSASQPFRIRTLPGQIGESEAFTKRNESKINRAILIAGSIIAALILFLIIDVLLLMKSNCGLLALITKSCNKNKSNSMDYKSKTPPAKIAQHQPKTLVSSNTPYQPIKQTDEPNNNVTIPMND